ncbi:MAG: nicotinamide riboside transporter PnuC [Acidobacteriota bacterium]
MMKIRSLNYWEVFAVVFSFISVVLTIKVHIGQWAFGIVGVVFYFIVFYRAKLYANMWLQVMFIALQIYGWYEWLRGGEGNSELPISHSPLTLNLVLLMVAIIGIIFMNLYFIKFTDNARPLADSAATVLSLIAQWMLAKKYIENWVVWVLVNLIVIFLGVKQKLYLTAGLYLLFLILAIIGYLEWLKA